MNLITAAILLLAILLIAARLGLTKVFRKKTVQTGKESETKSPWWNDKKKSVIIMIFLVSLVWLSFPSEISRLFSEKPTIFLALIVAVATILISGGSTNFTKIGLWIGILAVLIILFIHVLAPANAKSSKNFLPSRKGIETIQLISTEYTLLPNEKLIISKTEPNFPSPRKVWSKTTSGRWGFLDEWAQNPDWPSWFFLNDSSGPIEIYLELPRGTVLSNFKFQKETI